MRLRRAGSCVALVTEDRSDRAQTVHGGAIALGSPLGCSGAGFVVRAAPECVVAAPAAASPRFASASGRGSRRSWKLRIESIVNSPVIWIVFQPRSPPNSGLRLLGKEGWSARVFPTIDRLFRIRSGGRLALIVMRVCAR